MKRIINYALFMLALSSSAFAMAPPAEGKEGGSPFGMLFLIVGIFAIMYFFMIRPQKKQQQKKQEMINSLQPGARIMTTGGIYGEVKQVKDTTVRVQIDDHTRIEIAKNAVASVISTEDDTAK
jgi:preprotein translocase subunit YajC